MGTGYTRNDTSNNIANGKVIDATDLDGEFDAIVTAFSTSGHTHDGTSAEGGAVTKLLGTSLTLGDGTAGTDITVTFDGETSDGVLKWMEDEDYFQFNDDILINTNEKLYFRDTGIYISSNADGDLDIVSDGTAVDSINIESAGGITLDAGTAASGVIFEDDGTEMLRIYNSSSDVHIESKVSNKDILIRGNDNGSDITAVTFDMSEAGLATFGGGITSTAVANTLGATSFSNANITNVGNIALDSITADGSTITITGNTTFADGSFNFNIASHDGSNGLQLGGVLVTATAAELNLLDGVSGLVQADFTKLAAIDSTATELNIVDGDTSASSVTVADADRVVFNDGGTMKQVAVTDLAAYFDDEITAMPNLVTTAATTVGALNSGSITSGFGSIDTGSSTITTTGLISGGSLDIDDVIINGTTIGHTDDTDLITLADGVVTVAGEISVTTLDIGGTNVGSTAAELNLLDGSAKSTSSITIADADAFIVIDGNTTKQIPASDLTTYIGGSSTAGQLSTGTGNTAIGSTALDSIDSDAVYNTALGLNAATDLTKGRGNVAIGYNTLKGTTGAYSGGGSRGMYNVAIGYEAMSNTHADLSNYNVAIGFEALKSLGDNGSGSIAIGRQAFGQKTGNYSDIAIGNYAGYTLTSGSHQGNTLIGHGAGQYLDGSSGSDARQNTFVGDSAGSRGTTGQINTCIGYSAGGFTGTGMTGEQNTFVGGYSSGNVTSGSYNTSIGRSAGQDLNSGSYNTSVGKGAGQQITSGSNNLFLGFEAGRTGSPGGAQTTGSNEIFLGDENITAANIQVDWTVASDQRDKTDFSSLDIGLDFVNQLKPYTFKWDKRIKYINREGKNGIITKSIENGISTEDKWEDTVDLDTITSDGTHKEDWLDIGFKAQDVETLEKAAGYKIADKTNLTTTLTNDGKQYGIKYNKFVPILVKAIQELSAKNDALEARIKTLEG